MIVVGVDGSENAEGALEVAAAEARLRSGDDDTVGAWCAFLDPFATLHASGVLRAGVDLGRLLVARPSIGVVRRVAVRMAASRAFSLVVIDTARLPGETADGGSLDRWATVVRRLALSSERSDTTVLLLTDRSLARSAVLPVGEGPHGRARLRPLAAPLMGFHRLYSRVLLRVAGGRLAKGT